MITLQRFEHEVCLDLPWHARMLAGRQRTGQVVRCALRVAPERWAYSPQGRAVLLKDTRARVRQQVGNPIWLVILLQVVVPIVVELIWRWWENRLEEIGANSAQDELWSLHREAERTQP